MRRLLKVNRRVAVGAALAVVVLGGAVAVTLNSANAAEPLAGNEVSSADYKILVDAAGSCPALTPARLAGQVMVASQFGSQPVEAISELGAQGTAGLTPQTWQKWAPWPDASPTDREASIVALAHDMCQLVGQLRVIKVEGDPWQLALAAHRIGLQEVVGEGAVPAGAREYVDTVERYAAWYALQPRFGGSGDAAPSSGGAGAAAPVAAADAPVTAVPGAYLKAVVAAGKVCPEVPPSRIAAQLMMASGFDPQKLGPTGEQGIAQFLPQVWVRYVPPTATGTPWEAKAAIAGLGRTMCALVDETKDYPAALAAFSRGESDKTAVAEVTPFVQAVEKAQQEYAKDTRLALAKPAKPGASAKPSVSAAPSSSAKPGGSKPAPQASSVAPVGTEKPATPGRTNQPPVKAADADGSGRSYGPYYIENNATKLCIDIPGFDPGPRDGPVNQAPCNPGQSDNQQFSFVPRAVDSSGNQLYWIRNVSSNYCIDPPGVGSMPQETKIYETGCYDADNQHFRLVPTVKSGAIQHYQLRNDASGLCLEVPGDANAGRDVQLQLYGCKSGDDMDWALKLKSEM